MEANHDALRYKGNICISGLTASGKTTHSHLLAGEFGLTYISGSQIQLNFMGVSPVQSREFWVTAEAKSLWNERDFSRIDSELLRLESTRSGCIFDTSTMPWRHKKEALCIWLQSDLSSRVLKSVVSHHGNGGIPVSMYPSLIEEKDHATWSLYNKLYGINIGTDLSEFDLVIDISALINRPTLQAALRSIRLAHAVIRPAAAFYLTGAPNFKRLLDRSQDRFKQYIKRNDVTGARARLLAADSDG